MPVIDGQFIFKGQNITQRVVDRINGGSAFARAFDAAANASPSDNSSSSRSRVESSGNGNTPSGASKAKASFDFSGVQTGKSSPKSGDYQ